MRFRQTVLSAIILILSANLAWPQNQLSQGKDDRLFNKGIELIDHANYVAAREVLSQFLSIASLSDTRRGEAEYYVAFCALSLGHSDGEKLIDQFISNYPSNTRAATAYYDLANFFYNEKNYEKASVYFKKVNFPSLSSDQQNQAHFKWGYSYFNAKKLDEALEQFNFVKKQSSSYTPAANYYAGFIEYSKGSYDEALVDLKLAERSTSYADIVPFLIINTYYRQRKYDDVIQYANTLKGRDVANAGEIAMLVADAYFFKTDYKKAVDAYEKYLAEGTDRSESSLLFRAGYANYALGQDAKAIGYLSKAAAGKDSTSYYASYYLGILYLKKGDKNYAMNSFDYARKNSADSKLAEESFFQFAKVSYDAGKPDQAIREFEKFSTIYPSSKHQNEAKELLAQAYVNGNDFNKAIEYIEALPSRNKSVDQAYQKATYLKGIELFNKDDYPGAVKYFEKSLQYPVDPNLVVLASFWNGEAYSVGRKYDEAIANYQRALAGGSADAELTTKTKYGLGYAYYNQQVYDKALINFKDFVNRSNKNTPNYTDGLIRLADCYYVTKQYSDALSTYTKATAIGSPDNDYVLLQTGAIYGIERKYTDARKQFSALVQGYPKSQYRDEALFQQAQFEIEQGNYQIAIDGFTKLINGGGSSRFLPYAYLRRAVSFSNLKQYDKTIADYTTLIKQFPTHPAAQEALLPLQEALNTAGRSSEFEGYLTSFKRANPEKKGIEGLEYETGKNFYFDQQYQKSITSLNNYLSSYPQSIHTQEAKYYIAESHYRLREYEKALPIYNELSNDMTFAMGSKVMARVAELEFKLGKYANSINSFHRLERLASNKKEKYNAWSGLMESFYLQAQYDSADVYAKIILEKGNVNAGAQNKATLYLGKSAMSRGDYESAKDEFLNTLNSAQDEYGAEAKYLLGQIAFLQKEYKQCYETLTSLNKDFASYNDWVGKSYLLLADNFLAQNDVFQARLTLQSLVDNFPLQSVKDEAKMKLKQLEQAEAARRKAIESDTVDNEK